MNKILILLALILTIQLQAQDINAKLGGSTANETYDITDSGDNLLFRVQGDGNVGIGTATPAEKLDVVGNIAISGTVDGIDIATDVAANTAKVTNATHSGDVAGATTLTIGNDKVLEAHLKSVNTPTDEYALTYEATSGGFEWQTFPSGADNLGNHTATQVLNLSSNWLSGDGDGEGVYVASDGDVGIGTASPAARLHVRGDDGLLVQGKYDYGITQNLGSGVRMHFYPKKGAFRAGQAWGTEWDDANIGNFSTALGAYTTASGIVSTAMGRNTTASGDYSTAMGYITTASGYASTAMGRFNVGGGSAYGWYSTDPLFEIGIGADGDNKANAMTVLKNGNVGIGTISPTELLDVNSNGIRIRTSQTPASSSADGYTGQIVWDVDYMYVCTDGDGPGGGTDTWKRSAMSVW